MHMHTRSLAERENYVYHSYKGLGSRGEKEGKIDTPNTKRSFLWLEQLWVIFNHFFSAFLYFSTISIILSGTPHTHAQVLMAVIYSVRWDYVMLISFFISFCDSKFILSFNIYWLLCNQKLFKALDTGINKVGKKKSVPWWSIYCTVEQKTIK